MYLVDSIKTEDDKLALANPLHKNLGPPISGLQALDVSPQRDQRGRHGTCAARTCSVLPQSQRLRNLLRHDSQLMSQKGHSHA